MSSKRPGHRLHRWTLAGVAVGLACSPTAPKSRSTGPTGTVVGTIIASWGGGLGGISVVVTPRRQHALSPVMTAADGTFSIPSVPVDTGYLTLDSLPAGCTQSTATFYLLTPGDTATVNETVQCVGGTIQIYVTSPPDVSPSVHVVGPNNTLYMVTFESMLVPGLPPGNYRIEVPGTVFSNDAIVNTGYARTVKDSAFYLASNGVDTTTVTVGAARGGSGELWAVAPSSNTIDAFTGTQLAAAGSLPATTTVGTAGAFPSAPRAVALDSRGNMWVAGGSKVAELTTTELASSGSPTPLVSITLPSNANATALAFDTVGTLWVADTVNHAIDGYTSAQLAASGQPTPRYQVTSAALVAPVSLAFDQFSDLWVADNTSQSVWGYTSAQLTSGAAPLVPAMRLQQTTATSAPTALAFDATGDLWITGSPDTLAMFSSSALTQLTTDSAPPPSVTIVVPGVNVNLRGLVLDNSGDVWLGAGQADSIFEYAAPDLSTGQVAPSATFSVSIAPWTLAFDPHGARLPLEGARVHVTRSRLSKKPVQRSTSMHAKRGH